MLVSTLIPDDTCSPGQAAWFVKSIIEGLALGCVPCWPQWKLPPLYESGVRFALPEDFGNGSEMFLLPPDVYQCGWGDCDRLVIWRLAELLRAGKRAGCRADWEGDYLHVYIRHGDGRLEDPSERLGRL